MHVKQDQRSIEKKATGRKGITRRQLIKSTAFAGDVPSWPLRQTKFLEY